MVVMVTFSKRTYASCHAGPPKTGIVSAPDPAAGHCQLMPLPQTPKHTQASLAQSLVGVTAPFSWVLVHTRFSCALEESVSLGVLSPLAGSPGWEVCCGP